MSVPHAQTGYLKGLVSANALVMVAMLTLSTDYLDLLVDRVLLFVVWHGITILWFCQDAQEGRQGWVEPCRR